MSEKIKKIVLAYSGGLDTSVIVKWLKQEYNCQIIAYTADIGQSVDENFVRDNALRNGAEEFYFENLQEEFVKDYIWPMMRANPLYEGLYMLGTAIARPLIAKRQIEIAKQVGADAVSHGATGKGNDQIRFELSYYALNPDIKVIAPWREWKLNSRSKLIEFANQHQINIPKDKRGEAPFSIDENILHTSSEGKILEDPEKEAPEYVYQKINSPQEAPDQLEHIVIEFDKGDPISVNKQKMTAVEILVTLNKIASKHAIGRIDIVENRFIGMKSRGVYETPGGTLIARARRAIESITLDKGAAHLKDELMPKYAEIIYNGFWFSPEREMLQAAFDLASKNVSGQVEMKLYKGNIIITSIKSPVSLYSSKHATFENDNVYNQKDAEGFIKLNALRLKLIAMRDLKNKNK